MPGSVEAGHFSEIQNKLLPNKEMKVSAFPALLSGMQHAVKP